MHLTKQVARCKKCAHQFGTVPHRHCMMFFPMHVTLNSADMWIVGRV